MSSSSSNQHINDQGRMFKDMLNAVKSNLWVALPCIVESYDPEAVTITAKPTLLIPIRQADGSLENTEIPLLQDVPVMFTRGGGCTITHPINKGDECLVVFADRCIDIWWQQGGIQPLFENRKHDLSDGFAIFAPQSQAMKINDISTEALQIRTDDGQSFIELNPQSHEVTLQATKIKLVGDVETTGTLSNNGKNVGSTHQHGQVQSGNSSSGVPM